MKSPDLLGASLFELGEAAVGNLAENHDGASELRTETVEVNQQLHAATAAGHTGTPVEAILARLGRAVLLPIRHGEKRPRLAGWQRMTLDAMDNPAYVAELNASGNIGVLLGAASENLCSVDIDHDEEVEPFLAANPALRNALRTRRARGGNIWVRVRGSYPSSAKLSSSDKPWGEWRADGCQTVIHGAACDQSQGETELVHYQVVQDGHPAEISFEEITWPRAVTLPWKPSSSPDLDGPEDGVDDSDVDDGIIILPSGEVSIQECGDRLFRKIAPAHTMFQRGGEVVESGLDDDRTIRLHPVTPAAFRSRIESFGRVLAWPVQFHAG